MLDKWRRRGIVWHWENIVYLSLVPVTIWAVSWEYKTHLKDIVSVRGRWDTVVPIPYPNHLCVRNGTQNKNISNHSHPRSLHLKVRVNPPIINNMLVCISRLCMSYPDAQLVKFLHPIILDGLRNSGFLWVCNLPVQTGLVNHII